MMAGLNMLAALKIPSPGLIRSSDPAARSSMMLSLLIPAGPPATCLFAQRVEVSVRDVQDELLASFAGHIATCCVAQHALCAPEMHILHAFGRP